MGITVQIVKDGFCVAKSLRCVSCQLKLLTKLFRTITIPKDKKLPTTYLGVFLTILGIKEVFGHFLEILHLKIVY